jgi:membrane protease YdiL (CAAX protease family)
MTYLRSLFKFDLRLDRELVLVTVASTLLLMFDWYTVATTGNKAYDRMLLYTAGSLLLIIVLLRKHPRDYGFTFGDWRAGLSYTLLGVLISTPIIWWAAQDQVMIDYYGHRWSALAPLWAAMDLFSWEFLFRGLILFSYARLFGAHALWLSAVPFAFAHLGKPPLETFSTIFGGFLFGLIAWRTRSFFYPFLIHWYFNVLNLFLAALNAGSL